MNWTLWTAILGMGVITFSLRLSFIALQGRLRLPPLVTRALRFVPAAVLTALVTPALFYTDGALSPLSVKVPAGLIAALVAWRSRNILLTIAAGMGSLWLLRWVF